MKVNVFKFTDSKTGEEFTGSIEDYYKHLNITKAALQSRVYTKRVSREWLAYKDNGKGAVRLTTYTDVKTGKSVFGTKTDAQRFFGMTWRMLDINIQSGLIATEPSVETKETESKTRRVHKKSDSKTKRALNKYYLERALVLGV
ncbi:hypothetical protein SGADD02_01295 [Streptococcus gallolyticus]|uniref:Uncharacterized protein n=1 Tax=Streptococcus gallolyticus TaxID=315405 RepID=A0A139MV61_9STRE|nr:hypothetical protein [Streptococcus gallolyticus]KXT67659.1 hypothetical protein SGADD02_01295 [Streptococcus gallolyticus]QBX24987.1 hypothetical protein Javan224_0027 [Streptococcus phage Javan224]